MGYFTLKQPEYLDPSYKLKLDFWGLFWKENPQLTAEFHMTSSDFWGHSKWDGVGWGMSTDLYYYPKKSPLSRPV